MKYLILLSIITFASCSHSKQNSDTSQVSKENFIPENHPTPKTIEEAVNSPFRTEVLKQRDFYRHPVDTLTFFGVKSSMKVLEITPGNGWYTEILAPFLSDKGQYVMATRSSDSPGPKPKHITEWSMAHPAVASKMQTTTFNPGAAPSALGSPASMDMVLTFRNVHNWMAGGFEDAAFKSFFTVLKKGGILGIVEHRAPESWNDPKALKGYVRESDVIKMAKKAGFKYLGKSEVNSNPKDTKDYVNGVWTLPPTYTLKDQDREKYQAIGESDRMTLKFSKP